MLILVIEKYTGWLFPWKWAIILALTIKILKVFIGKLDKDVLKIGQAMSNYSIEEKVQPKPAELLDRVKNIEKKVSPETVNKKYETYFDKDEKN